MNRGSRYRRNNRKRKTKKIIIISISAVLVLFMIFMVSGLFLSDKVRENDFTSSINNQGGKVPESEKTISTVNAFPLALLEDGSSFLSRLSAVNDKSESVCISLNSPDGMLLFNSSVASHFSLSVKSDASALTGYVNSIEGDGLYSTALLYLENDSNSALISDVYYSIWCSIACEAIQTGVNDVLLVSNSSFDNVDKLCSLANGIHLTEEEAIVGITVPQSVLEDENYRVLISKLAEAFDYLAIDTTNLSTTSETTVLKKMENTIKDFQDQILYHKMRILLPHGTSEEDQTAFIELLTKYNINNWQISPNK